MCAILTTHNMDIVWDDDPDFIDVKMILFTEGGEFLLKNEVLYLVEKEEEQEQPPVWGWSRPGKAPNLERHRVMYSHVLYNNFWGPTPVYNKLYFKKFSSLRLACLVRLMKGLPCTTRIIHSSEMLLRRSVSRHYRRFVLLFAFLHQASPPRNLMTRIVWLQRWVWNARNISATYGDKTLRHPRSLNNINRLLGEGEATGFPGCIGLFDCMHSQWKIVLLHGRKCFRLVRRGFQL